MLAFSFVYPLEKRQALELEVNTYNEEVTLLNQQKVQLEKAVEDLQELTKSTLAALSDPKKKNRPMEEKFRIQDRYNTAFDSTKEMLKEIEEKKTQLVYKKERIKILKRHIMAFKKFESLFFWLGLIFTPIGLICWFRGTIRTEQLQKRELEKLS
ncbi:MAG TPA: hypothetical protein P5280_12885 [Cyclobacteriaceae bacterium]|nr:hypothetical protein [Cyclobacteriaceae bacterium]